MRNLIIILFFPICALSQTVDYNHGISWNTNFIIESNNLDKSFLETMLYGGYITAEMKENWINKNNNNNLINFEFSNSINRTYKFKKGHIGFSVADRNLLNAKITNDFLRLTLEGNNNYQDKTLDFSNTNIRAERFQQYKITYAKEIKNMQIKSGISFLNGNHHLSYIIRRGDLYTAPFGSSVNLDYNINAFMTDTSNFSLFTNNGNGIAFDIGLNFNFQNKNIDLSITDLGFIMWNTSSNTFFTDSSFNFQGIEIDNIFDFNDSILEANNLIDDIPQSKNNSFKSYIPAILHLSVSGQTQNNYLKTYTIVVFARWQPYSDVNLLEIENGIIESNYTPLYYIQSVFKTKYLNIFPKISYGGYTQDINFHLAASYGKTHQITLGSNHIEQFLKKENYNALSLYLILSTKI